MATKKKTSGMPAADQSIVGLREAEEFFADGVGPVTVGFPLSKIAFYTTDPEVGEEKERHRATHRVVVPTSTLFEFCFKVIASAKANADTIHNVSSEYSRQVQRIVALASSTEEEPNNKK